MYKVTLIKTSKSIDKNNSITNNELDLDWEFKNYEDALNKYEEIVIDEAKHSSHILYTMIHTRVRLYSDEKIMKQINFTNI